MKCVFPAVLLFYVFVTSCTENKPVKNEPLPEGVETSVEIPNTTTDKSMLDYNNQTSLWTLNDQLYSGYAVSFYPDRTLKEKAGILKGRKQNQFEQWFPDGHLKQVAHYQEGKLHGEKKLYSPDSSHILITHLNYYLGKAHGEQKQWYPTGELYKKLNLNLGKEEGLQQAFRKNGDLYANYEAKNGRIFGLRKASLCFGLEDEKVKNER